MNLITSDIFTSFKEHRFSPFREVSVMAKITMSFRWKWADRTNHIHFPYFEWPGRSYRVKMSWCLVNEVTMDLTGMTSLGVSDDIRDHLWPIISESLELISKFWTRLVSSTHTVMLIELEPAHRNTKFQNFMIVMQVTQYYRDSKRLCGSWSTRRD